MLNRRYDMATIGIRMTENEKMWVNEYARTHKQSVSDFVRTVLFEKMDDELDLRLYEEYLNSSPEDKATISFSEAKEMWST
jgi:hypothetical protein